MKKPEKLKEISNPLNEDTGNSIKGIIKFTDNRSAVVKYDIKI